VTDAVAPRTLVMLGSCSLPSIIADLMDDELGTPDSERAALSSRITSFKYVF
jgi:hypothetical protein